MAAIGVSLQNSMQKALQVKQHIENRMPQSARELGKELCKDARAMIVAELSNTPMVPDEKSVQPIIADLCCAVNDPAFHGDIPLNKTMSKACRLFIELSWYQAWRIKVSNHEHVLVTKEFKKTLVETTGNLKKVLVGRTDATGAWFEFKCAKEGAKRFQPPEILWAKYLIHVADLTAAGADRSVSAIWDALKNLVVDIYQDCPVGWHLWYQSVHVLSWEATRVHSMNDFEAKVVVNIPLCKEKGGNFSLCLAKVFMDLIRRDDVDPDVKARAFRGTSDQEGLIHLINWKCPDTAQDALKHPSKILHKIFRKADRFWATRDVTTRYLAKMATQDKYLNYRDESSAALKSRLEFLAVKESARHATEKHRLDTVINQLQERLLEREEELEKVDDEIYLAGPNRATGGDPGKIKSLEERAEVIESECGQLKREISECQDAFQLQEVFVDMINEEAKLINSLLPN